MRQELRVLVRRTEKLPSCFSVYRLLWATMGYYGLLLVTVGVRALNEDPAYQGLPGPSSTDEDLLKGFRGGKLSLKSFCLDLA
jgi:hypothetical protein